MSGWSCSIGWFRFTVPESTVEKLKTLVGGDWFKDDKSFQGYTDSWLSRNGHGGLGRICTGSKRAPKEVHVDLSQEMIADWPFEKYQQISHWVLDQNGHFGRIDIAMDDQSGVIELDKIYEAIVIGQSVSHFRQSRLIEGLDVGSGDKTGKTVTMGSRQSDTFLRIYDKAAEQRAKAKPVEGPWIRWEIEWKNERSTAVAMALSTLDQESFQKYIVGVFRTTIDFRDCTREDDPKDRYHARLLPWWKLLTEGMQRAKLHIVKLEKNIEEVKEWAEKSLSPMLGLLCAHPEAGERWLVKTIVDGVERWRTKHLALLQHGQNIHQTKRKLRWWNPRDGFSAIYATSVT